jgi:hypothetical protein
MFNLKVGDLVWIREEYVGNTYLGLPKGIHTALLLKENINPHDSYDWEVLVKDKILYLSNNEIEQIPLNEDTLL